MIGLTLTVVTAQQVPNGGWPKTKKLPRTVPGMPPLSVASLMTALFTPETCVSARSMRVTCEPTLGVNAFAFWNRPGGEPGSETVQPTPALYALPGGPKLLKITCAPSGTAGATEAAPTLAVVVVIGPFATTAWVPAP